MAKVHKCLNPACKNMVPDYKEVKNSSFGRRAYCSLECFSAFSPSMLKLCKNLEIQNPSREVLKYKLDTMLEDLSFPIGKFCSVFGVNRSTLWRIRIKLKEG